MATRIALFSNANQIRTNESPLANSFLGSETTKVGEIVGNSKYVSIIHLPGCILTRRYGDKDWPPSTDFKTAFPELYEDFNRAVPVPNYVRRDGVLNVASHFPSNTVAPDLGMCVSS